MDKQSFYEDSLMVYSNKGIGTTRAWSSRTNEAITPPRREVCITECRGKLQLPANNQADANPREEIAPVIDAVARRIVVTQAGLSPMPGLFVVETIRE